MPERSLSGFANKMRRLATREIPEAHAALTREVATIVSNVVISGTPVDTSLSVSNWRVNVGSPTLATILPLVPGRRGSTASSSRQLARSQARLAIGKYKAGAGGIFIANRSPVIESLNNGTASARGSHFVERALQAAHLYIEAKGLNLPEA